jgi:probable HAF family extracellular repeat protein
MCRSISGIMRIAGVLTFSCLPGWLLAQTQTYTVTELTTPTGAFVQGGNNRHEFVGGTLTSPETAVLWTSPTTPTTLSPLGSGGSGALAYAINDAGQTVGVSLEDAMHPHATFWQGNTAKDLGTLPGYRGSGAFAINGTGAAAGYGVSLTAVDIENNPVTHAFSFDNGTVTDLGTLGGSSSVANGINSNGQIVGWSNIPSDTNPPTHATLWNSGVLTDLGTLGGENSFAMAINDAGVVVGEADLPGLNVANNTIGHAVMWKNGLAKDLGVLGTGTQSSAYAVNSSGDAVGISDTLPNNGDPRDVQHAVLWSKGQIVDLNTKLPAALQAEVVLEYAQTIADDGSIIAEARNQTTPNCCTRVFLLTPVAPLAVSCPSATAQVATAYSSAAVAAGGISPYSYSTSGTLAPGLALASAASGVIGGTPTAAGTFNFVVHATDSSSGTATHACTITVAPRPDFALHSSPAFLQLKSGSSGSVVISTSGSNGFAGAVALSVSPAPEGATFSLKPSSINGVQTSALTIYTGSAAAGTYPIVVTGIGAGLTHTTTIALTIIGGADLTVSPTSLSFGQVHRYAFKVKQVEVSNSGTTSARIGEPHVKGSEEVRHSFIPISLCGRDLAPTQSCRILVALFAKRPGRLSATLEIPTVAEHHLDVSLNAEVVPPRQ